MPKISELDAGTALSGTEKIPVVQGGTTKRITPAQIATYVGTGLGYYNVVDYGALNDGTNSAVTTTAIQAAIDAAGAAGGGVIYFPAGEYVIRPATISIGYAIGLYWPNITLLGDGWNFTRLSFKNYDGSAPATNWPISGGVVVRGHGMYAPGSASGPAANPGIAVIGMEIDGNAGNTGNRTFPASIVTGDGWDITNQGIRLEADKFHDNVQIIDCWIHSFFGESIYGGGANISNVKVRGCKLGDNNADGISMSTNGDFIVEDNEIYTCENAACENAYFDGRSVYRNNYIYDCPNGSIQAFTASSSSVHGTCEIYDNQIYTTGGNGMYLPGARNTRVYNNLFHDCEDNCISLASPGPGGSGIDSIKADNVEIFNNRFVADTVSFDTMIRINASDAPTQIHVHDNFGTITTSGRAAGKSIGRCININTTGGFFDLGIRCRIWNNICYGGLSDDHSDTELRQREIFGAFEENLLTMPSKADFLALVYLAWRVEDGPARLNVRATWSSGAKGAQNVTLMNQVSYPIGYYTAMFMIPAEGAVNGNILRIYFNADVSSRIFMNGRIEEIIY